MGGSKVLNHDKDLTFDIFYATILIQFQSHFPFSREKTNANDQGSGCDRRNDDQGGSDTDTMQGLPPGHRIRSPTWPRTGHGRSREVLPLRRRPATDRLCGNDSHPSGRQAGCTGKATQRYAICVLSLRRSAVGGRLLRPALEIRRCRSNPPWMFRQSHSLFRQEIAGTQAPHREVSHFVWCGASFFYIHSNSGIFYRLSPSFAKALGWLTINQISVNYYSMNLRKFFVGRAIGFIIVLILVLLWFWLFK